MILTADTRLHKSISREIKFDDCNRQKQLHCQNNIQNIEKGWIFKYNSVLHGFDSVLVKC